MRTILRLDHGRFPANALFILIIAALALLTIGLSGLIVFRFATSVRDAAEREMTRAADDITFALEHEVANATNVLTAFKVSGRLRRGEFDALYQDAVEVARGVGVEIIVYDERLDEVVLNTADPPGTPPVAGFSSAISARDRAALDAGKPVLSDVFFGPAAEHGAVFALIPMGAPGHRDYTLAAQIGLDGFAEILARSRLKYDWTVSILDRKGIVVARSRDHERFAGRPAASLDTIDPRTASGLADGLNAEGLPFLWGYRRSEATGWTVGVGMPRRLLEAPLASGIAGMFVVGFIVTLIAVYVAHRTGGPVALAFRELREALSVLRHERGAPRPAASFVDISRVLAAATAELLAVEDRRRYVQSAAEVGVWQWDLATGEEIWSERYRQIIGAAPDVVPSLSNFLSRVHPDERRVLKEAIRRNVAAGDIQDYEFRVVHAARGEERWIHTKARVERDAAGRPVRVLGVGIDITARKRAAQEIEDSAARLRALVETVSDGVMLIDAGGDVILFNPACERLFGYPAAEIVGRNLDLLMPPDGEAGRAAADFLNAGLGAVAGGRWELSGRRRDGTPFPLALSVGEVRREGKSIFVTILHDLTAQQAARRERDDLQRRLMNAQEQERQRLARELHDETGQSLTAALLELKNVERMIADTPRGRLQRLRADLEEMGRSLHRFAWELRPTSLEDIGLERSLANYLAEWSARSGIHVDFHCKAGALATVPSEVATHIYRIVQEALTNVIKHASGVSMVSIVADRDRGRLQLTIEDDGRGFPVDAAAAGVGRLGLAGIRERLSLIAGQIEIESTPGRGATLFIRIDIEPREAAA